MSEPRFSARQLLAAAIHNDPMGVISEADARAMVSAALQEISSARDPAFIYEGNLRFVRAAQVLVGRDADAEVALVNFVSRGQQAVHERLAELDRAGRVPAGVDQAFRWLVEQQEILGSVGALVLSDAVWDADQARWSFVWRADGRSGPAFALRVRGRWVISPEPLEASLVASAERLARSWFSSEYEAEWLDEQEHAAARDALAVLWQLWPDEEDPLGLRDRFPKVFKLRNDTGSDEGFWIGLDPQAGGFDAGAFN